MGKRRRLFNLLQSPPFVRFWVRLWFFANTVFCGLMRLYIAPSKQIKIWLSASHESKGFVCKMDAAGCMFIFTKFYIDFFCVNSLSRAWVDSQRTTVWHLLWKNRFVSHPLINSISSSPWKSIALYNRCWI